MKLITASATTLTIALTTLALTALALLTLPSPARAQFAQPFLRPNDISDRISIPPGAPIPNPPPLAPGSGPTPSPLIPGDTGAPLPPPAGHADMTPGTNFPAGNGTDRTIVYIYRTTARGRRAEQTIRPDGLSQSEIDQIDAILGINMLSGESVINADASDSQLEQIQQVLNPYPAYTLQNSRKYISADPGAPSRHPNRLSNNFWNWLLQKYPDRASSLVTLLGGAPNPLSALTELINNPGTDFKNQETQEIMDRAQQDLQQQAADNPITNKSPDNLYDYAGPLPTVRTFARYLVLSGVVAATIWMAMAAWSVVMGDKYGGARVIAAAAGLMMLLCAFTIWKIVQMNTFNANSDTPAQNNNRPQIAPVSRAYLAPPILPATPSGGRQYPQRSGVPLFPLGASLR